MTTITLNGKSSRKTPVKVWGKQLTGVTPGARGGFAFQGAWLPKDGQAVHATEGLVMLCADRGTPVYWVVRVGGEQPVREICDWSGTVEGLGEILSYGTSVADAVAAAQAAGVPVMTTEQAATPRRQSTGRPCGYGRGWRPSEASVCPCCGDDC